MILKAAGTPMQRHATLVATPCQQTTTPPRLTSKSPITQRNDKRAGRRPQRVGLAMVAAVPAERRWHLVMGGRRVRHCLVNLDTDKNEETASE
jgi:hypothetical protein